MNMYSLMSSTPHNISEIRHGVGMSSSSFILIVSRSLCEYTQFLHSTVDGFLSCVQFGAIISSAAGFVPIFG